MKKSLLLIIYVTLFLPMLFGSIARGQIIKEVRSVTDFDRINLKGFWKSNPNSGRQGSSYRGSRRGYIT